MSHDDFATPAPRIIDELWCITQERYVALIRAEAERDALVQDWRNACALMNKAEAENVALRALLMEVAGRGRLDCSDELQDRIKAKLREDK